ncbi:MAG: hypothetical protein J5519_08145, partial [Bacteroidales bacterium]|nr:hypothetical protein [Bacteroidales bacterium]
ITIARTVGIRSRDIAKTVCRIILADKVLGMKSRGLGIEVPRGGYASKIRKKGDSQKNFFL